jgi:hypothetical protein
LLCFATAGGEEATKLEVETRKGTKRKEVLLKKKGRRFGGEVGNCREATLFFDPPDDISLEETVHSLADANTLLLGSIYTRAPAGPGRPADRRRLVSPKN